MQSIPHSMAHRGAGATRTNARWHPYTPPRCSVTGVATPNYALLSSSSSSQQHHLNSQESYLITPAPSVYSISPTSTFSQSPHPLASALHQTAPSCLKQTQAQKTQLTKANYVASLVDQAVKSLTDIWRPENIPAVFSTQTDITVMAKQPSLTAPQYPMLKRPVNQLPSPRSPSTLPSPLPAISAEMPSTSSSTSAIFPSAFLAEHFGSNASTIVCEKDLVPIRTFVQEVLRRSRTTCSVLQSALCYIEAVRGKVPELVENEKRGLGAQRELTSEERITKENMEDSKPNFTMDSSVLNDMRTELMLLDPFDTSDAPTVLQNDTSLPSAQSTSNNSHSNGKRRKIPPKPLIPLPPLPSPLLCPRRTFLAALILASKFLQDRCYSNRAWAKLSGLPPREVGRCERALGDALGWRLWVGKGAPTPRDEKRNIQRTRSEGAVMCGPTPTGTQNVTQFLSPPLSDAGSSPECEQQSGKAVVANRALRRAATLPDETAMRSMAPRYQSPGSLPFSFACPIQIIGLSQQQCQTPSYMTPNLCEPSFPLWLAETEQHFLAPQPSYVYGACN
ncbi:PCL5 [Sanghuangporus vaninii]